MKFLRALVTVGFGFFVFLLIVLAFSIFGAATGFKASNLGALLGTAFMAAFAWGSIWCAAKAGKWAGSKVKVETKEN